jgi:uncharacterized membrane protein
MRIPPDLRQVLISVASISAFAVLLVFNLTYLIYVYIGGTFVVLIGYSVYRTSKMIPVLKQNGKEAERIKKEYKDKILHRETAKDTQPFFVDYEREKIALSKKILVLTMIPLFIVIVLYAGIPFILKFALKETLSRIQIVELYILSAFASVGASLVIRRRMGLNMATMTAGTQLVHAPKAYIVTEKGVLFDPPMKIQGVDISVLKFPVKISRVEEERGFIEIESKDPATPTQIKVVRLYSKNPTKLLSVIKNYSKEPEQTEFSMVKQ